MTPEEKQAAEQREAMTPSLASQRSVAGTEENVDVHESLEDILER